MELNKDYTDRTYGRIYWNSLKEFDLSIGEGSLMALIEGLSKKWGHSTATEKYMSNKLNASQPTIDSWLLTLLEKELIEGRGKDPFYRTNRYAPTQKWNEFIKEMKRT